VLHSADISNPYKPFAICKKWAKLGMDDSFIGRLTHPMPHLHLHYLVVEEFFAQGDREKREGLDVSAQCNRDASIGLPNMQLGFLEAVVTPLGTYLQSLTNLPAHLLTHSIVSICLCTCFSSSVSRR